MRLRIGFRTIRARLALRYAATIFISGLCLLALSYLLVDHALAGRVATRPSSVELAKVRQSCKLSVAAQGPRKPGASDTPEINKCVALYARGVSAGASRQRVRVLNDLLGYSLIGLGTATALSGLLGWSMAARVLRPLQRITAAARRASDGRFSERVGLSGPKDELQELADTFDEMLGRLDAAFSSERAFIANASHELRTPLTAMRTAIEVVLQKPGRSADQLAAVLLRVGAYAECAEQLVDALLTLAKSDAGVVAAEYIDLATAAEDVLDALAERIAERSLRLTTALAPAELTGDRVLIERMVTNVIDNATRHCDVGGACTVSVGRTSTSLVLTVTNTGDAIPGAVVPTLIEPFRRAVDRTASGGFGLGLAIVHSVARAHGGDVALSARAEGGLTVQIALPLDAPRSATRE